VLRTPLLLVVHPAQCTSLPPCLAVEGQQGAALLGSVAAKQLLVEIPHLWCSQVAVVAERVWRASSVIVLAAPALLCIVPTGRPSFEASAAIEGQVVATLVFHLAAIDILVDVPDLGRAKSAVVLVLDATHVPVSATPGLLAIRPVKFPTVVAGVAIERQKCAAPLGVSTAIHLLVEIPILWMFIPALVLVVRAALIPVVTTPFLLVNRPAELPTVESGIAVEGQHFTRFLGCVATVKHLWDVPCPRVTKVAILGLFDLR